MAPFQTFSARLTRAKPLSELTKHLQFEMSGVQRFGFVAGQWLSFKTTKPDGTFYTFPDFSAYNKDSQKLAQFLLDKVRVVTVPGKDFGMEGHLRMSFCGTLREITEGVERIKWALDPDAPNELYLGDRKLVRDWR